MDALKASISKPISLSLSFSHTHTHTQWCHVSDMLLLIGNNLALPIMG